VSSKFHRRSKSSGEVWLDHRPTGTVEIGELTSLAVIHNFVCLANGDWWYLVETGYIVSQLFSLTFAHAVFTYHQLFALSLLIAAFMLLRVCVNFLQFRNFSSCI